MGNHGGSDASSLTDDGMTKRPNRSSPPTSRVPGLAASWACRLFQPVPTASANAMLVLFSAPLSTFGLEQDFRQAVQPGSAASRQRQRSSAVCLHGSLRIRMSAILAGRLGIWGGALCNGALVKSQSPWAAVRKRVVIRKRMQFSIVSCTYAAQCLGASCMKPTRPRPPACRIIPQCTR